MELMVSKLCAYWPVWIPNWIKNHLKQLFIPKYTVWSTTLLSSSTAQYTMHFPHYHLIYQMVFMACSYYSYLWSVNGNWYMASIKALMLANCLTPKPQDGILIKHPVIFSTLSRPANWNSKKTGAGTENGNRNLQK